MESSVTLQQRRGSPIKLTLAIEWGKSAGFIFSQRNPMQPFYTFHYFPVESFANRTTCQSGLQWYMVMDYFKGDLHLDQMESLSLSHFPSVVGLTCPLLQFLLPDLPVPMSLLLRVFTDARGVACMDWCCGSEVRSNRRESTAPREGVHSHSTQRSVGVSGSETSGRCGLETVTFGYVLIMLTTCRIL